MKSILIAAILAATTGPTDPLQLPRLPQSQSSVKVSGVTSKDAVKAEKQVQDELKKAIAERRDECKVRMDLLAAMYSDQLKQKVTVEAILFATIGVSEDHDGAIVVLAYGESKEAMLLIYRKGKWDMVPESFQTLGESK